MTPESAYSAASIVKELFGTVGIVPPLRKFNIDDETLGFCMQGYYGGRAEDRIRHAIVQALYVDFISHYPTVYINLGLWDVLTAEELQVVVATSQVRHFLQSLRPEDLFNQKTWKKLNFFALVHPDGDILPVRTVYGRGGDQTNIGLNPLTSELPIWYAGPDLISSWLLTGRIPKISRAFRLRPIGKQKGMKSISLGNEQINPYRDDFFRVVIEQRKSKDKTDPLYYFLKILANAGCYGIYAEINRALE